LSLSNRDSRPVAEQATSLYCERDLTGLGSFSKTHLYNLVERGQFPQPTLRLGSRFTRWSAAECDLWFSDPTAWIEAQAKSSLPGEGA
jgi:predicted DNA-binding transcriptional regulator AlpA